MCGTCRQISSSTRTRRTCFRGHADGIVEQQFRLADMDQERRQSVEAAEQWRCVGMCGVGVAEVLRCDVREERCVIHRIAALVPLHRFATAAQIRPRREQHGCGGKRVAGVAQREQCCKGEAAAGRIACYCDGFRIGAGGDQATVYRDAVVDCRRKTVLRCEAIVEREDGRVRP